MLTVDFNINPKKTLKSGSVTQKLHTE